MLKWLGQRPKKKKKQETGQPQESEVKAVDEDLVAEEVGPVEGLVVQREVPEEASADSIRSLLRTAVADAEEMAASIKMKAREEAEAEAATIINEAKQEAEAIKRKAEVAAQKESEDVVSTANRKAEIAGAEAKQKALLSLLRARERIEEGVKEEYKRAYTRLSTTLQDLLSEGQKIEAELRGKRARLWEGKDLALKEYEAPLLNAAGMVAEEEAEQVVQPKKDTKKKTRKTKKAKKAKKKAKKEGNPTAEEALKEEVEQLTQLEEEAVAEQVEQPVQPEEEAAEEQVEQPVQPEEEAAEEQVEQPTQPEEEAVAEQVEQPTQPEEEAAEEQVEQPTQPEEEAVAEQVEQPTQPEEEAVAEQVEQPTQPEEEAAEEELNPAQLEEAGKAMYTGEVELAIGKPVDPKMMSKLYNYLQTTPEIRLVHTSGSWDRGTDIRIALEKPIPLIGAISSAVPEAKVTQGIAEPDSPEKGKRGVKRIKLVSKKV